MRYFKSEKTGTLVKESELDAGGYCDSLSIDDTGKITFSPNDISIENISDY